MASPLERSRSELQVVLDTIYGTGDSLDRSKASIRLKTVATAYLQEAQKAGLQAAQIQQDTRGRAIVFEFDEAVRLFQIQVPDTGHGSHLFLQDLKAGTVPVFYTNVAEKPAYVALTANSQTGVGALVLAGTVPGPDNWVISAWQREGNRWVKDSGLIEQLFRKIPTGYSARLNRTMQGRASDIELTGGPLNSARVSPTGDVEVCQGPGRPCIQVPWTGSGY